MTSKHTYITLI
nr:unnamed protein product [Callosobruchus chinensis]CAH7766098.1 unnamed protein product [Callosobruchus chinensis]